MLKKVSKKLISFLMAFTLIGSILPAFGAEGEPTQVETNYTHLIAKPGTKPSEGGALQLLEKNGQMTLCDEKGNPIQLRGMSTHGLHWYPQIINNNAFATLANDWGSNVIRLAMYVGENGYATNPGVKKRVIDGIDLAIKNDMYVMVDWHVLSPGDPNAEVYSGAMDFFKEISSLYPNNKHIIYELANEPNNTEPGVENSEEGWKAVKSYAEPIIKMLRESGNENIVIVGSPNWSQRPDLAADNPIEDDNTMYSAHFYTGTHLPSTYVMNNVEYALENGVAVFITEWGTSEATGHNGPYIENADVWLDFLGKNNISWCNWSLTNKNETSGAFTPFEMGKTAATSFDPGDDQVWEMKELSVSGEYVRARIKGIEYEPIDRVIREDYETVIWDFEDGTAQGFVVNADSPVTEVELSNVNNAMEIKGLSESNGLGSTGFWSNVRISADEGDKHPDILGAEKITIDVIVDKPTTVSIAAIPQSEANGWANPTSASKVTEEDFEEQDDGTYKAVLTISKEDSPNFEAIANDTADSIMTNIILFVGTPSDVDVISLDNITVSGNRAVVEKPVEHDPLGLPVIPADFETEDRQGWNWDVASGVKTELKVKDANGSKAISWEVAYPDVKPEDGWAASPRIMQAGIQMPRGNNEEFAFDFYIDPLRATTGYLYVNLAFAPPALGYWAQPVKSFNISLESLADMEKTEDGLYHFEVVFDIMNLMDDKVLKPDTFIRDIIVVVADGESDFAGTMYMDNMRFQGAPNYKYGDLDKDSEITSTDYALLKKYVLEIIDGFDVPNEYADLDGDGNINSFDLVYLKRYVLEMIKEFPVEVKQ